MNHFIDDNETGFIVLTLNTNTYYIGRGEHISDKIPIFVKTKCEKKG